ncbi:hypothetical protein J2N86_12580 [Legionella lytica]|uniref:Coiled-coil protein n=1 Tax=Legionella lytica TaxID=96232 RepID=A0ABY4Y7Q9_9GAMM|nr:hypothetical protein [Legionella lytica]USQ13502.1 hypothetical protein J2N86_12580 [Legionella lytica]
MVDIYVDLSSHSQELLRKFQLACALRPQEPIPTTLPLTSFFSWFQEQGTVIGSPTHSQQEIEFLLLSLRTELLHDLCLAMNGEVNLANKPKSDSSLYNTVKLGLLTTAGMLVVACDGFDCVVTIMTIFALPAAVVLASGFIFSTLSIIAFCGFELAKLSDSLDIKLTDAYKLLDVYFQQYNEIKNIRKKIAKYSLLRLPENELQQLGQISTLLEQCFIKLSTVSDQFEQALHDSQMHSVKLALSTIFAVLRFGGSFCAAQTVSLSLFGLIMTSVSPVSLPVLLCSTLVGFAAMSLFWFVEFPGLESLVSSWLGLDDAKIATLCNRDSLTREQEKLGNLKEHISEAVDTKQQLATLKQNAQTEDELVSVTVKASTNRYSFMRSQPIEREMTCSLMGTTLGESEAFSF